MLVTSVLLLLCVSALTAESYRHDHPLHRRQASQEGDICALIGVTEICSNGYLQEYADLLGQCNLTDVFAGLVQDSCRRNSIGSFCVVLEPGIDVDTVCGNSPTTCTPECRDHLITTRDQLGCCVNVLNVTDILMSHDRTPYRYSLWSLCGVEPVTEQCEPGPIQLNRFGIDPTCNESTFFERLLSRVLCRRSYIESTMVAYADRQECQDNSTDDPLQACSVNETGQYCAITPDNNPLLAEVRGNCTDTSVCSPQCVEILRTLDCCFLFDFNDTSTSQRDFFSYEFWTRCNLKSPGMCAIKLTGPGSNHGSNLKPAGVVAVIAVAVSVIFQNISFLL